MGSRTLLAVALAAGQLAIWIEPALANDAQARAASEWDKLSGVLLQLLAVVLVMESALAALFQWRVYRMAFNARALKTPIMFAVGVLVVVTTGYNPMDLILRSVADTATATGDRRALLTGFLSAMIIAGGSAGIFALLARLGLRAPESAMEQQTAARLGADQAWLSIRVKDAPERGPIQIGIEELAAPDTGPMRYFLDHANLPPLAGTIDVRGWLDRAAASFSADAQRFPSYGGRKVAAGRHYRVIATWQSGDKVESVGVFRGQFASRAVIDLSIDLSRRSDI